MGKGGGSAAPAPAPVIEPVKSAKQSMDEASQDASRAIQLRRGLASTFSRSAMGRAANASATSGTATKLGV